MKFKSRKSETRNFNKKSQLVMEGLVDIIAIIFTFLTALIFFVIFKIEGCGNKDNEIIANMSSGVKSNNALLSYLRKPVVINNKQQNIGDLIILYAKDKNYEKSMVKETEDFLGFFDDCALVRIYDVSNKNKILLEKKNSACDNLYSYEFSCSSLTLPSKTYSEKIMVECCITMSAKPLDTGVGP
ncbi:MAG: hypothetical protein ACQXXF_08045 [Thermoplasmatota archaeon]|jgi:hypothetical protein